MSTIKNEPRNVPRESFLVRIYRACDRHENKYVPLWKQLCIMLLIGAMIFTLGFIQGVISTPEAQLSTKKFLRSIVAPNITTTSNVVYTERATE